MPKFLSEEHRAKWIAAQKRSREAKRKTENEPIVTVEDHDGEMEVPPPVPMGTVGRDPDWMVKALGGLYDRRSCLQGEMEKVEAAIQAVKALA